MSAGTYMLKVGSAFYVGSSTNLKRRKIDHLWRLKNGVHHCAKLQAQYGASDALSFTPLQFLTQHPDETTNAFRDRLRASEQATLDQFSTDKNLANTSTNSRGPDNGESLTNKWKDPIFREKIVQSMKDRTVSPETRSKMAAAKQGKLNAKSRSVTVTNPDGTQQTFDSVTATAAFFQVSQQLMQLWITGKTNWPTNASPTRERNRWIAPYHAQLTA